MPTSEDETNKVNHALDSSFKYIVIFAGGNWLPKLWAPEKYNETMKLLLGKYKKIKFILVGSLKEKNKYYCQRL